MVKQYWEDLLRGWQDLNYDVGGIILQHVHDLMDHREKRKEMKRAVSSRFRISLPKFQLATIHLNGDGDVIERHTHYQSQEKRRKRLNTINNLTLNMKI